MDRLINYIISIGQSILSWFGKLWDAVQTWFLDVLYNIFDAIVSAVEAIFTSIPVPDSWSAGSGVWAGLGTDVIWFANAIKLPLCITIILAAWGIRFLINLIPAAFTRV